MFDLGKTNIESVFFHLYMTCSYYSVFFFFFFFTVSVLVPENDVAFPLRDLCVPPSLASVACSEAASFINAAPTQLQAQALNSWPEFRPQLTLSLFLCISPSLFLLVPLRLPFAFTSAHLQEFSFPLFTTLLTHFEQTWSI